MKLEGVDEALKAFKGISDQVKPRIMRSALNAAMTPGLKAVRRAAPKGDEAHRTYRGRTVAPGFLSRSARKSSKISRDRRRVFGKIALDGEAFYGSFIEHGTRNMSEKPFFFDAIDRVDGQMSSSFFKKMSERIDKFL